MTRVDVRPGHYRWARDRARVTDPATLPAMATVSAWASSQQYEQAAVSTFLQLADYYLVVFALAHGHTVVTHEIPSASTKKIKIPDACVGLGVKFATPFEMLRNSQARFALEPTTT
jgi:hypothetical protein